MNNRLFLYLIKNNLYSNKINNSNRIKKNQIS